MTKSLLTAGLLVASLLGGGTVCAQVAGPVGWLAVSSDPKAEIFIDDADTHETTPQDKLALDPGHHKLKLVTADGRHERSIGFTVEAGKTTKMSFKLLN